MFSTCASLLLFLCIRSISPARVDAGSGSGLGCGPSNVTAAVGGPSTLQSPNYPQDYPPNSECWWTMSAPVGYRVLINFTTFKSELKLDKLEIYDASSQGSATQSYLALSGRSVPPRPILSNNNYVTMKFTSDASFQLEGFNLSFSAIAINCSTLETPRNGSSSCFAGGSNMFYCTFTCSTGFEQSGSGRRMCQSSGTWTGQPSSCNKVKCPELPTPKNGTKTCTDANRYQSRCNFSCRAGYQVFGSQSRRCSLYRVWSGSDASCNSCGPSNLTAMVELPGSLRSPNYPKNYPPNSACWWTITAPLGYHVQINFTTFKLEEHWDYIGLYDAPSQTVADQPHETIRYAGVLPNAVLSKANYITLKFSSDKQTEDKGFELIYQAAVIACPTLSAPSNGTQTCHTASNHTTYCIFFCNYGFTFFGNKQRTCQSNGTWSGNPVSCNQMTCPELPTPKNGTKRCTNGNNVPSECIFACHDGFMLHGSKSRFCDKTQKWSGPESSCLTCGNANLRATAEGLGSLQSPNYPLNYPPFAYCWWTITAPVGYRIQINFTTLDLQTCCDYLQLYDAPSRSAATEPYGTITQQRDLLGSLLSDFNYITLILTSDYTIQHKGFAMTYKAIAASCSILPTPSNGSKICYIGDKQNFSCSFSCNIGFNKSGSGRRSCQSNGTWNGQQVTCNKVTCPELPVLKNGRKRCSNGNYFDSECSFTCNDGYEFFGKETLKCSDYGAWPAGDISCQSSPPKPTCSVPRSDICDGWYNCPDKSDENGCTCPHYKFECDCYETGCPSWQGCIDRSARCNEKNDCGDWSDERNCQCSDTKFQCKDGDCIDRSKVNDGRMDCENEDDEFVCNMTQGHVKCDCMHDNDRCTSSGRCIPNSWIGDTIPDCENGADELCNASKFWCEGNCWVIINHCSTNQSKNLLLRNSPKNGTRCNDVTVLSNRKGTSVINWICITSPCDKCQEFFQCQNGQIVDSSHYCDTIRQCVDGSDEDIKQFGFRCSGKSRTIDCVLPQKNLYDSAAQCSDKSDLCFVNGEFRCFFCLDGKLIVSAKQVCDGLVDCYDMSDECLCANQSVCNAVLGEETTRCPSSQMPCHNDTDCVDMDKVLCKPSTGCNNNDTNLEFCHQNQRSSNVTSCRILNDVDKLIIVNAAQCDGRPECGRLEDECDCEPRPSFCDGECAVASSSTFQGDRMCDGYLNSIKFQNMSCNSVLEQDCPMRFNCKKKGMISIDIKSVCDGIIDCDDRSDENTTDCRNKRFSCKNGNAITISKNFECDGVPDCDNREDETREMCGDTRFYCDSGQPLSIDKKSRENGIKDCSDGSDECVSLFSNRYEMIANPALRALFWIMGFLALIGNLFIHVHTVKDIISFKNDNAVKLANNIFILSLTISDFLFGVYLIAIAAQGIRYSGNYCFVDKAWRSSNLCSGLGTLVLLSSQASAFIMAAMSTFRLVTVFKPFLSSSIKAKWIVVTVCSCWVCSIFLAILPRFALHSGYFVSAVWFPNMFSKRDVVPKLDMFILATRLSGNSTYPTSWSKVKESVSDVFKYNPIKGEFGYYGETSVCMPRFYVARSRAAWQYSTFIITIDFVLFVYMVVAYFLVYKKASGMKKSRSTQKDPNKGMQKRISRLLLTDFCCWIPVCILSYLSVAGVTLSPNVYIVSAGFLLPINSAMNPLVYSTFIGRHFSNTKSWIFLKYSSICSSSSQEADLSERCNDTATQTNM